MAVPQNEWFILDNPTKMDDLGVPLFQETTICVRSYQSGHLWQGRRTSAPLFQLFSLEVSLELELESSAQKRGLTVRCFPLFESLLEPAYTDTLQFSFQTWQLPFVTGIRCSANSSKAFAGLENHMFLSLEKIVHLSQSMLFGEPVDDHQVKTTFTGNVPFDAKENLSSDVFRSWRIPSKRGGSTVQRFNASTHPTFLFVS